MAKYQHVSKEDGFTLLEMLLSLLIIAVLTVITVPTVFHLKEKIDGRRFFNLVDADILYIQNQAFHHQVHYKFGVLNNEQYILNSARANEPYTIRETPQNVTYTITKADIVYNRNGTVTNPHTYTLYVNNQKYKLIFPLGKGRHRFTEE